MPQFPIVPSKTGMLFFDTLNVYLHPDEPEAQRAVDTSGVVPAMVRINAACREAGMAIFYAQADHRPDGKDFAPQIVERGHAGRPGEGPYLTARAGAIAAGSRGVEIIPELAPQPEDYVIKKHRWSSFFQTHLELSLRTAGIDTIMLAGGSTEVGVASTAYSARDRDFNLIILRDACRSRDPRVNDFFMESVFPIFARIMSVDQAIAAFEH